MTQLDRVADPATPPDALADGDAVVANDGSGPAVGVAAAGTGRDDDPEPVEPCPYLAAEGGRWRSTGPARDHRCTALDPVAVVSLDKQRRLCLTTGHRACPTFLAARAARAAALAGTPPGWTPARPFVRTAPVVVEAAPRRRTVPVSLGSHRLAEVAVAALAVVVLVLAASRLFGGGAVEPTPRPAETAAAGGAATTPSTPTESPAPTSGASSPSPAGSPTASATDVPTLGPSAGPTVLPSGAQRSYTVKAGDTLSGIAARFGVSWQAIAKANKIKSPYRIVRGQVLVIPAAQ